MVNSFGIIDQMIRSLAVAKKDVLAYYGKGALLIYGLLVPAFLFISYAFGRQMPFNSLLPSLLATSVFFTSSSVAPGITAIEAMSGTLERLISCPIAVWTILLGDLLASALAGVISCFLIIAVFMFAGVAVANLAALAAGVVLASLCFAAMALILSSPATRSPSNIQMLSSIVRFPLLFLSGVFASLSDLPAAARIMALVSPLTYFTDLARYAVNGSSYFPVVLDFLAVAISTIILWIIAVKLHNRSLPMRV